MGWFITQARTKAELIERLTEGDPNLRTHRKCVRGSTLWTIQENLKYPGFGQFIVAYRMMRDPGFGWGYKPIEESMGPADLSCPISYLDAVPVPDGRFAAQWRERVRQRHAQRRRGQSKLSDVSIGDYITLVEGVRPCSLVLVSKRPPMGRASDDSCWRIPLNLVERITPAEGRRDR